MSATWKQKIYLVLWIGIPLALGVWIRFGARSFAAGDLSFETTVLLGVIGGRLTGVLGGVLLALPAVWHGEWATLPFNVLCGFVAGQLRNFAPNREDIWSFSPFVDLSIYRWIRRNLPTPHPFEWQTMFFVTIVALRFVQTELSRFAAACAPSAWKARPGGWKLLIYATSVTVIGTELKIWNSVRIQIKLEEQERLLLHSRMEALQNQINPHFLFNTLNSVSSLVRFDPDTARELIIKLANILRRLLNSSDAFVPLREELEFIDNYLDIEVVRFGRDKLRVVKELETSSLDTMVPEHAAATAGGELDQARLVVEDRRRQHLPAQPAHRFAPDHRSRGRWRGHGLGQPDGAAERTGRNRHWHGQRGRAVESALR